MQVPFLSLHDVTDLLLELGTGFAFVGRQKELIAGDTTRKIDLLFYHTPTGRRAREE